MTIKISVGEEAKEEKKESLKIKARIRKTLDGNYMIDQHKEVDILILTDKSKILVIPKNILDSGVYDVQNRFMKFLYRKGLITPGTVQGGNIYGSLEAAIAKSEKEDAMDLVILNVDKWIDSEYPTEMYEEDMEEERIEDLTDPDEEDSTELGEVPGEEQKGSLRPSSIPLSIQRPYEE